MSQHIVVVHACILTNILKEGGASVINREIRRSFLFLFRLFMM
jgi:hypothetical protein